MGYPRENTIPVAIASAAGAAVTLKLPNGQTGALPGAQVGAVKPIGQTQRWRLRNVIVSFSAAPAAGTTLTITDSLFTWTIDVNGVGPFIFPDLDVQCGAGKEVDITLSAPGTTIVGHINALAVSEG